MKKEIKGNEEKRKGKEGVGKKKEKKMRRKRGVNDREKN